MDVYRRLGAGQVPTLVYIHGGGWYRGSKEKSFLQLIPYFEMGWTVVNIEYRRAPVSPAPAAVEDCRCALRWVIQHAEEYNVDTNKLVLSGHSAGGHLSLITGMLPRHARWRPEAIHALIGHSRSTYHSNYMKITDDDYMTVEDESYDDWPVMDDVYLRYAPCYAPKFSTKGLEYANKTATRRKPMASKGDKTSEDA